MHDVSVDVAQGEFFGIVGRNGSRQEHAAEVPRRDLRARRRRRSTCEGRLSPFIELGVGFNPDLTARDNVIINAIMLGLTRREARARFDEIIAFAELEEFLDLKLKNYSSGMSVRLAFSVAIQVDADVLLIDEVLAVGDAAFQQKCFEQFQRLKDEGRTIVFVTHDMRPVERFCDRAMLIERGDVLVARRAARRSRAPTTSSTSAGSCTTTTTTARATATRRRRRSPTRGSRTTAASGSTALRAGRAAARSCMEVRFHERRRRARLRRSRCATRSGHTVFATRTDMARRRDRRLRARATSVDRARRASTTGSRRAATRLTPSVARAGAGADALDLREDLASLIVHGTRDTGGVVDLPHAHRGRARDERGLDAPAAPQLRRRATPPLLEPHVDARGHRLEAALLRLGARLRCGRSRARSRSSASIYVVFTEIANVGDDVQNYGVYILFAIVLFQFFAEATGGCRDARSSRARTCCARCASRAS